MRRLIAFFLPLLLVACTRAEKLDVSQLKVPQGFHVSVFAEARHARMMAFSPGGVLLVSATGDGVVLAFLDPKHGGTPDRTVTVLEELNAPHGIAFHNGKLYVAETNAVRSYDWDEAQLRATNPKLVVNLPGGGNHFTRTLVFWNGKMYVGVGSDCNVCVEKDKRRAAVVEYNEDGSGERIFAYGTRNPVDPVVNPKTGTIWSTENSRDWLGDDLPPDEINDFGKDGGNFGWPYCYGNRVRDTSQSDSYDCEKTTPPAVALQAHSAPLGMAFNIGSMFPAQYKGDLFVSLHGSWNRSIPTGYKVIRVKLDANGRPQGVEDFITGWVRPGETRKGVWMGRPVGIVFAPDGAMYVSDDAAGVIYRVTWGK